MKEIKKEKRKRAVKRGIKRNLKYAAILLLLALPAVTAFYITRGRKRSEYESNVEEITQIDYSRQQEALNEVVEEGKMNVNYLAKAVFSGTVSEKFNVKNIKENYFPIIFTLYDEYDNELYTSKKIEPGYELNSIELKRKLEKGTHECTMKVGYAREGNASSVFPITIEVK